MNGLVSSATPKDLKDHRIKRRLHEWNYRVFTMRSKSVVKLKNWKAKLQKSLDSPEIKQNNNNKKNFGQMKKRGSLSE